MLFYKVSQSNNNTSTNVLVVINFQQFFYLEDFFVLVVFALVLAAYHSIALLPLSLGSLRSLEG